MPSASIRTLHHDALLTGFAVQAFQGIDDMIADKLFPGMPVAKQSDKYAILDKADWLRQHDTLRAPAAVANAIDFSVSSAGYEIKNYALGFIIPLELLKNADDVFQVQQRYTRLVLEALARDKEIRIAATMQDSGNLGLALVPSSKWGSFTQGTSDPIGDVSSGHVYIEDTTGKRANTLVIGKNVWRALRRHEDLLEKMKYVKEGLVSEDLMKEVFEVEQIIVGRGVTNTNIEEAGGSVASMSNIWGDHAFLARIETNMSLQAATLGVQFNWTGSPLPGGGAMGVKTDIEDRALTKHVMNGEVMLYHDHKIVAADLGVQLLNVL